jgi:hypothetical protein
MLNIYEQTVVVLESFVLYIERLEEHVLLFVEPNLLFQSELMLDNHTMKYIVMHT